MMVNQALEKSNSKLRSENRAILIDNELLQNENRKLNDLNE